MSTWRRGTVELFYRLDGPVSGPAVVFSNSLGCDLHMWDAQAAVLAHRFRVVRYDTRGHGRSGHDGAPATLEALASDVLSLLDHLGIARFHVCGLSLGGATALELAAHHPERLDRVIFANTAAKIGTSESWSERIAAVQRGGMAAVRDAALGRFLSAPFRARRPDVARKIAGMLEVTTPGGYVTCCEALRDADLRPVVGSIVAPSLIIASELDVSTPPAQSKALHAAIRGSELVVIPKTAHLSCVESPERFNAALVQFLGV